MRVNLNALIPDRGDAPEEDVLQLLKAISEADSLHAMPQTTQERRPPSKNHQQVATIIDKNAQSEISMLSISNFFIATLSILMFVEYFHVGDLLAFKIMKATGRDVGDFMGAFIVGVVSTILITLVKILV